MKLFIFSRVYLTSGLHVGHPDQSFHVKNDILERIDLIVFEKGRFSSIHPNKRLPIHNKVTEYINRSSLRISQKHSLSQSTIST